MERTVVEGYFDRSGCSIDLFRWSILRGDQDYVRVARDRVGELEISTVWLGADHQPGDGSPLIFETTVFRDGEQAGVWRYCTEDEALAGHDQVLTYLHGMGNPPER